MLTEIARIWQNGGLMKDVVEELAGMIDDAEYVYTHAWEACTGQALVAATEESVKERDRMVNRQERQIRRMLVEHLALRPGEDAAGCLAIMSMAKDAERIGDLAKDLFKLGAELDGKAKELKYFPRLSTLQAQIAENFPRLQRAIRESSDDLAREILDAYAPVKPEFKAMRDELLADNLPTKEAAITALLIHTFTRINAHIGNTASGVIFPLENIDFVKRGLREGG